jgi:hypothetical protein
VSLRMMDFLCATCGGKRLDVLMETDDIEPQRCCDAIMRRFWSRPPIVDARQPFYDPQAGRKFSSFHEADTWAKANGKVNMSLKEHPPVKTAEEKIAANRPKRMEAIQKSYYRLKYGYNDYPKLDTEDSLK